MDPTPDQADFSSRPALSRVKAAALYMLLALYLSNPVYDPADAAGDPSFQQALSHFTLEGLQAGKDYIFTYGPLGHFLIPRFHPSLFAIDWMVGLAIGLLAAWPVFMMLRDATFQRIDKIAVVAALLLLGQGGPGPELPYLVSAFLMVVLFRRGSLQTSLVMALFSISLAFLSLAKFTMLVLSVGFVGYLAIQFSLNRRFWDAALLSIAYLASLPLLWLAAWQDVGNFPRFVADSIEISRAYNAGMFLDGEPLSEALAALMVTVALMATLPLLWNDKQRLRALADGFFVLVFAYILWKSGMVRNGAHEAKLFVPAMLLPLLVPLPSASGALIARLRNAVVAAGAVIGVTGALMASAVGTQGAILAPVEKLARAAHQYIAPWSRLEALNELWRERSIYDAWPKTQKIVGDRSIDMFPPEQRLIFANGFNYRPRYTFQGYQATTPRLLELNGESYWGTRGVSAPEFVLFRVIPIDYRLPNTEDSQAMLALFYCYTPVLHELGLVLFERKPEPPEQLPPSTSIGEGSLTLGQTVEVPPTPEKWQLLSLQFGEQAGLFSRPNDYKIFLEYSNGRTAEYRILPPMTSLPFLLNRTWPEGSPMRESNEYFDEQVVSFRIESSEPSAQVPDIEFQISSIDPPEV